MYMYACYSSQHSLWITRTEEGPLCPSVCKSRSWPAHIQEHGNDIEAQDLWWSSIVYKTVIISDGLQNKQVLEKAPVKAKTITARPPPADTSQSQKKIFLWHTKKTFSMAPFSHRKCWSYSQSVTWPFKPYLESSKLADVSEHLVVVKIPPPHPHW